MWQSRDDNFATDRKDGQILAATGYSPVAVISTRTTTNHKPPRQRGEENEMNRYCKRCATERPHVKAGVQGRQMWQCGSCGKRHIEQGRKKQSPTVTVAVRLNEEELTTLERMPGKNRSDKIRFAITDTCPF